MKRTSAVETNPSLKGIEISEQKEKPNQKEKENPSLGMTDKTVRNETYERLEDSASGTRKRIARSSRRYSEIPTRVGIDPYTQDTHTATSVIKLIGTVKSAVSAPIVKETPVQPTHFSVTMTASYTWRANNGVSPLHCSWIDANPNNVDQFVHLNTLSSNGLVFSPVVWAMADDGFGTMTATTEGQLSQNDLTELDAATSLYLHLVSEAVSLAADQTFTVGAAMTFFTPAGAQDGTLDVNVIGFKRLDNPLWVSDVSPDLPPIVYPPPAAAMLANHAPKATPLMLAPSRSGDYNIQSAPSAFPSYGTTPWALTTQNRCSLSWDLTGDPAGVVWGVQFSATALPSVDLNDAPVVNTFMEQNATWAWSRVFWRDSVNSADFPIPAGMAHVIVGCFNNSAPTTAYGLFTLRVYEDLSSVEIVNTSLDVNVTNALLEVHANNNGLSPISVVGSVSVSGIVGVAGAVIVEGNPIPINPIPIRTSAGCLIPNLVPIPVTGAMTVTGPLGLPVDVSGTVDVDAVNSVVMTRLSPSVAVTRPRSGEYYSMEHAATTKGFAIHVHQIKSQVSRRQSPNEEIDWPEADRLTALLEKSISLGDEEYQSIVWNRLMHALNGNIMSAAAQVYNVDAEEKRWHNRYALLATREDVIHHLPQIADSFKPVVRECFLMWTSEDYEWSLPMTPGLHAFGAEIRSDRKKRELALTKATDKKSLKSLRKGEEQMTREQYEGLRADQLKAVVERLIKKLATYDLAIEWILTSPDRVSDDLALLILEAINKRDARESASAESFCFTAICHKRPCFERILGLTRFSRNLNVMSTSPGFKPFLQELYSIHWDEIDHEPTWRESKAGAKNSCHYDGKMKEPNDVIIVIWHIGKKTMNKLMHALNGNSLSEFPNTMDDVLSHGKLRGIASERKGISGIRLSDPLDDVSRQAGILQVQGVLGADVPRQMPLRGGIVTRQNAYTARNDLNHPEALLYPRRVRAGVAPAALINSVRSLQLFGVQLTRQRSVSKLTLSDHGVIVASDLPRGGYIRPDQITEFGFFLSDVAALIRVAGDDSGDSMVGVFLKMVLYQMSLSWNGAENVLPLSMEAGKFDSRTKISEASVCTLGYNDSPVFSENCGGAAAPVFPYEAAAPALLISFHASRVTVPNGSPFYVVRPSLLQSGMTGDDTVNYALLALALAPYPCGLHTVTLDTLDDASGSPASQLYIPFSSSVHINGTRHIHVIIPVMRASPPPTTRAGANNSVVLRPRAGPTTYGGVVGDAFIDVNWTGSPLISTDLAAFLGTWMADCTTITQITIAKFTKMLAEIMTRAKDLRFATELAATLAVRYPPLFEQTPGTPYYTVVNSVASAMHANFFSLLPETDIGNIPFVSDSYDFVLADLNPMFWSKIMSAAFIGCDDGGEYPIKNFVIDGSDRINQYMIHLCRKYAITADNIFRYHGQSIAMWNSSFAQTQMVRLAETLRKYFMTSAMSGNMNVGAKSPAGSFVASLQAKLTGSAPAADFTQNTIWSYINVPRNGFMPVWSGTGNVALSTPIPGVLCDVWVQLNVAKRALAFSPFIPPLQRMACIQEPGTQVVALGAGGYTIPTDPAGQAREIGINSTPLANDSELWNSRIIWHTYPANLYTLDGTVWAVSSVTSGNIIAQKALTADYTVPSLIAASISSAKTGWMPSNTSNGARLLVGVTAANGSAEMTQLMEKRSFAAIDTWIFLNVLVQPNTIVGSVGQEDDGIWFGSEADDLKDGSVSPPADDAVTTG